MMSTQGIDENSRVIGTLEAKMDQVMGRIDSMAKKIDNIETDYFKMKNRGWGFVAGLGLLSGSVGALVHKKLSMIIGP